MTHRTLADRRRARWLWPTINLLLCGLLLVSAHSVEAEGSRNLYPAGSGGFRANLEWRTSSYGGGIIRRRTLLKVFAQAGEYLLLGSSAVGVNGTPNNGDIRVFNPGLISRDEPIGQETIPATASFSCAQERARPGAPSDLGRIASRAEEINGPNTSNNLVPNGYTPCVYQAPVRGIYNVVFYGPAGDGQDSETRPSGRVDAIAEDFGPTQDTSITAWDVTVRPSLTQTASFPGRLFAYYVAMFTGGNGRPVTGSAFIVTGDGFRYRADLSGDPNGFVYYANQLGFRNTDGTPLYHDVLSVDSRPKREQDQLVELQGGVSLERPQHPIFFAEPDPLVLDELGISRTAIRPSVSDFTFTGPGGSNTTLVGEGGTFSLNSTSSGVYYIAISRDGQDFDPTKPENRVLRGVLRAPGVVTVRWDGKDNAGNPFPVGQSYLASTAVQGGEVHFPALDVENNLFGSTITLLNPPGGVCPPWNGGCTGAFYDDRGYITADGQTVGTGFNGTLCSQNVGVPPDPLFSDPVRGFNTLTGQRRWGFSSGGNPDTICDPLGGFGDKKGLDLWTYYPSDVIVTPLRIVAPTAVTLQSFSAERAAEGALVRWTTGVERDTWGFHVLRSASGDRAGAARVTAQLVPARGRGQSGASYSWLDRTARPGVSYTYWLQEIEVGGAINEYGPARLASAARAGHRLALPIVGR